MNQIKILIIDDSEEDIFITKRHFKSVTDYSFHISTAMSWSEGKEIFLNGDFHLLLVDYMLGESTALEIVSEIRKTNEMIPIIVMTGQGNEFIAAEITRAGADDYLVKGVIGPEILRISVLSAIEHASLKFEKKVLEEKLKQAQKLEAIGTLAGGIAHDFNNMLMGISGYIGMYMTRFSGKGQPVELNLALELCTQMSDVIRNILSFTRKNSTENTTFSINSAFNDFHEVLKHTLPKNIYPVMSLPGEEMTCFGDKNDFHQMLLNLAVNAIDAMPDGGDLKITLSTLNDDDTLRAKHPELPAGPAACIEISDTGSGIPAEVKDRIFDPFFTAKALSTQKGTGLGLTIVWQTVKQLRGVIDVISTPGKGTSFRIYFPAGFEKTRIIEGQLKVQKTELYKNRGDILVVDDEMAIRLFVSTVLADMGYSIHQASDGEMAVEIFSSMHDKIEAVILDLSMPVMNGRECLKKLIHIRPDVKVLIATGHDTVSIKDELFTMGALGIIQKPFQIEELAEQLGKVMALK